MSAATALAAVDAAIADTAAAMPAAPMRHWIAVACAEHARRGRDAPGIGFMQVCHGKAAPLRRLRPGDSVAYYAPTLRMGERVPCQQFISLGIVQPGAPYRVDMGGGFMPFRRDVAYLPAREAPIRPLLPQLKFVEDLRHWGAKFRFGLFEVVADDMWCIAHAMGVDADLLYIQ